MGAVYRKTVTKALPAGAKIIVRKGQRFAEWLDSKEKRRLAPVTTGQDGTDRIVITARTYTAKFRDGSGIVREVATGCRDADAARSVLGDLERRAELVKSKVLSAAEDAVADHQDTPLAEHIAAFIAHQTAKGIAGSRIRDTGSRLRRVATECGFRCLADLRSHILEQWLAARSAEGMGAVTRNAYREAWTTFGNWCVRNRRLLSNPLTEVSRADARADRRRHRRALAEGELVRLLEVAQVRPLAEYGRLTVRKVRTDSKRKRDTWNKLPLILEDLASAVERARDRLAENPSLVAELERLGWERALIYKTLALTGLRKGELASLTVGQLDLDAAPAFLVLDPADEKNRQGNTLPLRSGLADDLRQWLAAKAEALQRAAGEAQTVRLDSQAVQAEKRNRGDVAGPQGQTCQELTAVHGLPVDTLLFNVPAGLRRILDRDLKLAGFPKRDERGRTVDVHAMRTTFGTLLSKSGVAPRTAQAAMRHSTINLTMNVYTDPKLLDVAGAMEALPALPLAGGDERRAIAARSTGTDGWRASEFAPGFAPTPDQPGVLQSTPDLKSSPTARQALAEASAVSGSAVKRKEPLSTPDNGSVEWAMRDSNPRPPRCKRGVLTN